jgi:hypothetical protein
MSDRDEDEDPWIRPILESHWTKVTMQCCPVPRGGPDSGETVSETEDCSSAPGTEPAAAGRTLPRLGHEGLRHVLAT